MVKANQFHNARRWCSPRTGALVLSATFGLACSEQTVSPARVDASSATRSASSRSAESDHTVGPSTTVQWNEVARTLVASHNTNGPMASRVYALVSVAQFAASVAVDDHGHGNDASRERRRQGIVGGATPLPEHRRMCSRRCIRMRRAPP